MYLCDMRYVFFLIILTIISSCKYSEQPKTFEKDTIQLSYPSYLKKSSSVFPVSNLVLGLKNDYRDVFYIVVNHGAKPGDNGFNIIFDSLTSQLKNGIREAYIELDTSYTINNMKTRELHLSGIVASSNQEKRMYFIFNLFEDSQQTLYQTTGWCFRHKRNIWQKDIEQITHSLQTR